MTLNIQISQQTNKSNRQQPLGCGIIPQRDRPTIGDKWIISDSFYSRKGNDSSWLIPSMGVSFLPSWSLLKAYSIWPTESLWHKYLIVIPGHGTQSTEKEVQPRTHDQYHETKVWLLIISCCTKYSVCITLVF